MKRREFISLLGGAAATSSLVWLALHAKTLPNGTAAMGPLVVSTSNPRYFAKPDGTVIYLQGSHTWTNAQEWSTVLPASKLFHFDAYIDHMEAVGSNFMRYWMMEQPAHITGEPQTIFFDPLPWARRGPGIAADGQPKFDLTTFNQDYFYRMRQRCIAASKKGIYVSIMLFNGFSVNGGTPNPWPYHPFNINNNINSINGDPSSRGVGKATHQLTLAPVLALHRAYVEKVIDIVNDLDNVLYEISNEDDTDSVAWQYNMIDYIHTYEAGKAKQHPVGMTSCVDADGALFGDLIDSNAAWVSPWNSSTGGGDWETDPRANDGTKVVIIDIDHTRPTPATSDVWTWRAFLRGNNVIHMDNLNGLFITGSYLTDPATNAILDPYNAPMRRGMQQTGAYAARCDLSATVPHGSLSSTGYCIANPGMQYLVLAPSGGSITVDLSAGSGKKFTVEWLKVSDSTVSTADKVAGGSRSQTFKSPFSSSASVLFLNEFESLA